MAKKISTDHAINEITFRKYEKPYDLSRRNLLKKLCLSLGLLQPGDSRDVIVDILFALLEMRNNNKMPSSEEIKDWVVEYREQENLEMIGVASSNVRRQIKRLRDIFLVEKIANQYRINENLQLTEIFDEKISGMYLQSIKNRVRDYVRAVDNSFGTNLN